MLYERLADRYEDEEAKLTLVTYFQIHSALILTCIGLLPTCFMGLCYLSSYGCGYLTTRPYMERMGLCSSIKDFRSIPPRHIGLWDAQASNTRPEPPSPSIRAKTFTQAQVPLDNQHCPSSNCNHILPNSFSTSPQDASTCGQERQLRQSPPS